MENKLANYKIIAPSLKDENYSTAYILGNIAWLFLHSPTHCGMPIQLFPSQIFPAILSKQYVLVLSKEGNPVFYMAWANFSQEEETKYLTCEYTNGALTQANWTSGDRLWITFWVAPFGDSQMMREWIEENLFADIPEGRFLYHDSKKRGMKVIAKRGKNVTPEESRRWHEAHPIQVKIPVQFPRDAIQVM